MRLGAANPARARRVGALICATLWLGAFGAASARHVVQAASPPIVIPPATQIAPPSAPPPPPEPPPPAAAAPGTQPAPRSLLPTSIDILRDPLGSGIVMSGQLTGGSESALAVLLAIFAHSEAFDPTPKVKLAAADRDDRAAQALFTASVHGWPVTGVAAAALSESGGDVAVFYDYTPSFPASFARLRQALVQGGDVTLPPLHLADGSAVSLAPGWRVVDQGSGAVDLAGPLGEFAALGATIPVYAGETRLAGFVAQGPCCDPVATLRAVFPQLSANAQRNGQPVQILTGVVGQAAVPAAEGGQAALVLDRGLYRSVDVPPLGDRRAAAGLCRGAARSVPHLGILFGQPTRPCRAAVRSSAEDRDAAADAAAGQRAPPRRRLKPRRGLGFGYPRSCGQPNRRWAGRTTDRPAGEGHGPRLARHPGRRIALTAVS
jgi:hypothetical protein